VRLALGSRFSKKRVLSLTHQKPLFFQTSACQHTQGSWNLVGASDGQGRRLVPAFTGILRADAVESRSVANHRERRPDADGVQCPRRGPSRVLQNAVRPGQVQRGQQQRADGASRLLRGVWVRVLRLLDRGVADDGFGCGSLPGVRVRQSVGDQDAPDTERTRRVGRGCRCHGHFGSSSRSSRVYNDRYVCRCPFRSPFAASTSPSPLLVHVCHGAGTSAGARFAQLNPSAWFRRPTNAEALVAKYSQGAAGDSNTNTNTNNSNANAPATARGAGATPPGTARGALRDPLSDPHAPWPPQVRV
jgi:hypothetical protein